VYVERYLTYPSIEQCGGFMSLWEQVGYMSTCSHGNCKNPARYLFAPPEGMPAYFSICDEHACDFATAANQHAVCPKCNLRFVDPEPETLIARFEKLNH
jgi:hypothetical protein